MSGHQSRDGVYVTARSLVTFAPCLSWQRRWAMPQVLVSQAMARAWASSRAVARMTRMGTRCSMVGPRGVVLGSVVSMGWSQRQQVAPGLAAMWALAAVR